MADSAPTPAPATSGAGDAPAPAPAPAPEKKLTAKEERMLKRLEAERAKAEATAAKSAGMFGFAPLIQSQSQTGAVWSRVSDLAVATHAGSTVLIRGRLHNVRDTGRFAFIVLRQAIDTIQCVVSKSYSKELLDFVSTIPKESVIDVTGKVTAAASPILSVSKGDLELQVEKVFVISAAAALPFQLEDAARSEKAIEERNAEIKTAKESGAAVVPPPFPTVLPDTRFDHRWIDLRTPASQGIMRISSGVCTLFREFLLKRGFVEIQTPKLLGGASEGGSAVFTLKYFGNDACLAQSPQLYKQMCAACSDFERVFEIGPVFRAENSNTHRHLCEFHGLDLEMAINEHYYEVLDVFADMFVYIFQELNVRFKREVEAVRAQFPFEDLKFFKKGTTEVLRITYEEGIKRLQAAGVSIAFGDDLSTPQEKQLGAIIKEEFDTDFYMMDQYPLSLRPFYTMPTPDGIPDTAKEKKSNSYDFFIRGEEIVSGAQRVHEPELLTERAKALGIPVHTIHSYIESFRHGALPHGGGGVGLERVVMLFLDLGNIRKASMFPRDPKRLFP